MPRPALRCAATLLAALLLVPAAAAHADVSIAGAGMQVYANGTGQLDIVPDGRPGSLFAPEGDDVNVGHAGLALVEDGTPYDLSSAATDRTTVSLPALTAPGVLQSVYKVGPDLQVAETLSYTDHTSVVHASYAITNVSAGPIAALRAGELASMAYLDAQNPSSLVPYASASGVGATTVAGEPIGLLPVTPWTREEAADPTTLFSDFDSSDGLANLATNSGALGAEVDFANLAAGGTVTFAVDWSVGAPATPVQVTPGDPESLRTALQESPSGSVIDVPAGQYVLAGDIALEGVTHTLVGAGARVTTISGGGLTQLFSLSGAHLGISGITLTAGNGNGADGGAIDAAGSADLALADSAVTNSSAVGQGGGIVSSGVLRLIRSTISGNAIHAGSGSAGGGGLAITGGRATIVNSTISGNSSDGEGGGLQVEAPADIDFTTIAANTAATGAALATHTSFAPRAFEDVRQAAQFGPAFDSSILSGPAGSTCTGDFPESAGATIASDATCNLGSGNLESTDPQLGALGLNGGGPTDTMAPGFLGPAVDFGSSASCPTTDQNGLARPQGAGCDAGAVEDPIPPAPPPPVPTATPVPTPTAAPPPAPTPTATPTPVPPPVVGKTINVGDVSGTVQIKVPGSNRYVTIKAGQQIPVGTVVDVTHGTIVLTSATGSGGGTQHAQFFAGVFKVSQAKGKHPVTLLTLAGDKPTCPKASSASAATKAKKVKSRKLWGNGSGSFRTQGQYSAATVRGTEWLTQDSCSGTLVRVSHGVVAVDDFTHHKTVLLRAGKSYLAKPPKHH